mgnify:FL=1
MKDNTRSRKKAIRRISEVCNEREEINNKLYEVYIQGKAGFDALMKEMGKMMAEAIMYIEREEISGSDYHPFSSEIKKWASQSGSVYIGDQKVRIDHPRLRDLEGEIGLKSYQKLKESEGFSEELLGKVLRGISCRKYGETITETAKAFGVSPSSVSRHIIEVTGRQLKEFKERDLSGFDPFAIFIDTIHRYGEAFMVCLGIDCKGEKQSLGFWQGATENAEVCGELLADMERRGLKLLRRIIWITDGGKGIIKALKERFGKKVIHQRCSIHKDRNIQKHLPKRYRKEAHRRFRTAFEQNSYADAKQMFLDFEKWLRGINESAADSLLEAIEEILTLHRLKVSGLLKKTLHSTNPIESMFSKVRDCERNIKRYRDSGMMQRWLASVLLYCEKGFQRVKGFAAIKEVIERIDSEQANEDTLKISA